MIIAALPRCGATKYCLDLSEKTNIPFIGEYRPLHINGFQNIEVSKKSQYHETGFQPLINHDIFVDAIVNPDNYIVLINDNPHLILPQAKCILLRKNIRNVFYSTANILLKSNPNMKASVINNVAMFQIFEWFYAITIYLERTKLPIIWYEDYFNNKPVNTEYLDKYSHRDYIYKYVETLLKSNDGEERFERIKEQR